MGDKLCIALCEDEREDAEHLENCIGQSGIAADCALFFDGEALLDAFAAGRYDVVFVDIYLTGMSGVELAAKIRQQDKDIVIAFTTASTDHTLESYRLGALKYLEKPVKAIDVKETLELALFKHKSSAYISFLIEGRQEEIPLGGILYFEHKNHAVFINTTKGVLRTSQSVKLNDIEGRLPSPPFWRCHYSFIVNFRHVQDLDKELGVFIMENGEKTYIKRQLLKKSADAFEDYLFAAAKQGSL